MSIIFKPNEDKPDIKDEISFSNDIIRTLTIKLDKIRYNGSYRDESIIQIKRIMTPIEYAKERWGLDMNNTIKN
jgi:hypothetical protein